MEGKRRHSISELRVGLFVVLACVILAIAIFTIGTQVGLLEETFHAKTFLNNVSGLKPGDLVRLGGVEVGNIVRVQMSEDRQLPQTVTNTETLAELARLDRERPLRQSSVDQARSDLDQIRGQAPDRPDSAYQRRLQAADDRLNRQENALRNLEDRITRARGNLQNIAVYMQITSRYRDWIRSDSEISLGSIGLLGDRYIEITLGRSDQSPMVITEEFDATFGSKSEEVVLITGERQASFQELITGANDILVNFETLSSKLVDLLEQFEDGRGTIGKFVADDSFYDNLNAAVASAKVAADNAGSTLKDISQGSGTIAALIRQRELYDRLESVSANLDEAVGKINQGDGTLGRLVNDSSIYDKSDKMISNVEEITGRMSRGEGTLGKLSTDDQLYGDLRSSIDRLSALLADIEAGKGTLGRLAKDEQLYENINEVSSEVVKLIYDFRQNPKKFLTIKFEIF